LKQVYGENHSVCTYLFFHCDEVRLVLLVVLLVLVLLAASCCQPYYYYCSPTF
jgi:hypothetical protein